ncbi:MAG: CotH kinase family protein [Cyclobacteriaceae bacterium]
MKKLLFGLSFSALVFLFSCKNDDSETPVAIEEDVVFAVDIENSEVPYIVITTHGAAIKNEPKIPAIMRIYENGTLTQRQTIGIEFRGSTSFRLSDKKSFGIETWDEAGADISVQIFGFPEEEDWILNGHVVNLGDGWAFDQTLMFHQFGYELFRKMGNYAARTKFVEIEINGVYQGVYVFMEKLKRDNERIDIKKLELTDIDAESITGGYIIKIDKTSGGDLNLNQPLDYFLNNWDDDARYTEEISWRSDYDINRNVLNFPPNFNAPYHENMYLETYFLYEYPKAENITFDQKQYIQKYIHDFETALLADDFSTNTRTYTDYIDLNSFVDFFIINEITRNVDGYRLSTYMHKDRGGKLKMGPIWDLNIGYSNGDRVPMDGWVINYNQYVEGDAWMMPFWWPRLLEDPIFRTALKSRWNNLRSSTLSTSSLLSMVDVSADYLKNNGSIERNYTKWNIGVDYDGSISSMKSFLEQRTQWMDSEIDAL